VTDVEPYIPLDEPAYVYAPWSDEQVENINYYQQAGAFHPFTCRCPHPVRNSRLKAFSERLFCEHCKFEQLWVFPHMADGSAMKSWEDGMRKIGLWPY
jgi:hypothetical protein